jgi:hypothetical protein
MTDLRRSVFRLTGGRAKWIDPILRKQKISKAKQRAWFADQYRHPHESKHTIDEVLGWFEQANLQFVRGVPAVTPDDSEPLSKADLFQPKPVGTPLDHMVVQIQQIAAGNREGGFFLMIGQRPASGEQQTARREVEMAGEMVEVR